MELDLPYYTNSHGQTIKKCCASCANRKIDEKYRICELTKDKVLPKFRCDMWRIRKGLKNVGGSKGRVKSLDYIRFISEKISSMSPKDQKLITYEWFRQSYREATHKDIYMNI